jgi:hypothetical protein
VICEGPYTDITITGYGVQVSAVAFVVLFNDIINDQSTGDLVLDVAIIKSDVASIEAYAASIDTHSASIDTKVGALTDIDLSGPLVGSTGYIGKSANTNKGDFLITFLGVDTLTIGTLPPGVVVMYAADIELVRQINAAGLVVATYHRDDTTMLITGGVLTVTGAAFALTDSFIIFTNIPRQPLYDVMGTTYTGKKTTATGKDFVTAYQAATQILLSSYPAGVSAFTGDDIEFVRQISSTGVLLNTFTRVNATISVAANVLTISEAAYNASDTFIVVTNVPRASAASSGVGGGSIVYSNASGDFIATITNATKNITITGLSSFTLEAMHVVAGSIKKIAVTTNVITNVALTNVAVSGGVITVSDTDNFVTGDVVVVTLIGPDKAYDKADYTKVLVGNSEYGHYTSVETLVSETNLLGYKGNSTGTDADTLANSAAPFVVANVAQGYLAYQTTDGGSALVSTTVAPTTTVVETATLSGGFSWYPAGAKAYSVPYVNRYEIPMEGYNFLTLQYSLAAQTNCNAYFKIYGTLNAAATADSDALWINLSADLLGAAAGLTIATTTVATEGLLVIDTPTPMLKYMVKLVVESNTGSANTNVFTVLVKKSS